MSRGRSSDILMIYASTISSNGSYLNVATDDLRDLYRLINYEPSGSLAGPQQMGYRSIVKKIEAEKVDDLPGFIGPELELSATSTKDRQLKSSARPILMICRLWMAKGHSSAFSIADRF